MPKRNFGKGGKGHKKRKRKGSRIKKTDLIIDPDLGIIFAIVEEKKGGTFLDVICTDGKKRKCHISGKFWKKVWCNKGDIIVVSLRNDISIDGTCDLYSKPDQSKVKKRLSKEDRLTLFGETHEEDAYIDYGDKVVKVESIWGDDDTNIKINEDDLEMNVQINNENTNDKFMDSDEEDDNSDFDFDFEDI